MSSDPREDIHITWSDLIEVGKDFCKGINIAAKSKLLKKNWFPINKKAMKDA